MHVQRQGTLSLEYDGHQRSAYPMLWKRTQLTPNGMSLILYSIVSDIILLQLHIWMHLFELKIHHLVLGVIIILHF